MKILLLGYGKMGKAIELIALERGHEILGRIDQDNAEEIISLAGKTVDAVIEFSTLEAAVNNIRASLENGWPVVSGTTGWLQHREEIESLCKDQNGAFFYASNYSIGVNLFLRINSYLARLTKGLQYDVELKEIHHIHKKDAPSGTALTLAEGILEENITLEGWSMLPKKKEKHLQISVERQGEVPGTHIVTYSSEIDDIQIRHEAHSRKGFALGAVIAAEWLQGRSGVFGMEDLLGGVSP